jgi:hypothetical protein
MTDKPKPRWGTHRKPKIGFHLDPEIVRALEAFQNSLPIKPTVTAVVIKALVDYLEREGFPPSAYKKDAAEAPPAKKRDKKGGK